MKPRLGLSMLDSLTLACARFVIVLGILLALAVAAPRARQSAPAADFSFLQPWFRITEQERVKLTRGEVVVRALDASDPQILMLAVSGIRISPDEFLAHVGAAWSPEGRLLVSGRFGNVPTVADVSQLSLAPADVNRLRSCRAGDCPLILGADEIAAVREALMRPGAAMAVQQVFRNAIFDRTRRYQQGGLAAVPEYSDRAKPASPATIFAGLLKGSAYLHGYQPRVATFLEQFPSTRITPDLSFLEWSKVIMNGKEVVRVSHVSAFRPDVATAAPAAIVATKQVYASRYMDGQIALTMLFAGKGGMPNYLVHVHQSALDELGGAFSGLKRVVIEGRIKQDATGALAMLRDRLEESTRNSH